jgi:hypothetical protein
MRMDHLVWRLLPLYTVFVLVSSILGIAGISCFLYSKQKLLELKKLQTSTEYGNRQKYYINSDADRGIAMFTWLSGCETLFFGLAQMVILKRLLDHIRNSIPKMIESSDGDDSDIAEGLTVKRLFYSYRVLIVMSLLVVCSGVACVATSISAALAFEKLRQMLMEIVEVSDQKGQDDIATKALIQRHNNYITDTNFALAQFVLSKAVVLVLVVCCYLSVGPFCVLILRRAENNIKTSMLRLKHLGCSPASADEPRVFSRALDVAVGILESPLQAAIRQRRRLVFAFNICFWTILPRLAHDIMYLIGNWNNARSLDCGSCGYCQSFNWLMSEWLWQTPEFMIVTFSISSTLPLALSLLLLISDREKRILRSGVPEEDAAAAEAKNIRDRFKISFVTNE